MRQIINRCYKIPKPKRKHSSAQPDFRYDPTNQPCTCRQRHGPFPSAPIDNVHCSRERCRKDIFSSCLATCHTKNKFWAYVPQLPPQRRAAEATVAAATGAGAWVVVVVVVGAFAVVVVVARDVVASQQP